MKQTLAKSKIKLTVVGSLALDTIATPAEKRKDVLGGSVSYACAAAALFAKTGLVGVAGTDFPTHYKKTLQRRGIDLAGLEEKPGKTFRWSGVYAADMNSRQTLSTHLNVFAEFNPVLPEAYRASRILFLANIHPELQLHVLDQARRPALVAADTMNLWIETAKRNLLRLISKVDLLFINDEEARMLAGTSKIIAAAQQINRLGPAYVIVKKGEHGSLLVSGKKITLLPAFPVASVVDPTGAGDAFAGGMLGTLAAGPTINLPAIRRAMLAGTVVASFAVEAFGLERLAKLTRLEFKRRLAAFQHMLATNA